MNGRGPCGSLLAAIRLSSTPGGAPGRPMSVTLVRHPAIGCARIGEDNTALGDGCQARRAAALPSSCTHHTRATATATMTVRIAMAMGQRRRDGDATATEVDVTLDILTHVGVQQRSGHELWSATADFMRPLGSRTE